MSAGGRTAIVWFRQDLRINDQPALVAAAAGGAVIPVYVLDESVAWGMGGASRWWLHGSLGSLAKDLRKLGAGLILRRGEAARVIPALARETGAGTVHVGIAHEPAWRQSDEAIGATLHNDGVAFVRHRVATLIDPEAIRTRTGSIYGMYTPFARAVEERGEPDDPVPPPKTLRGAEGRIASDRLEDWGLVPATPDWAGGLRDTWQPGEAAAMARLSAFLDQSVTRYATGRNLPGEDGTSRLSPHLHWGEISPRTVWHAVRARGDGQDRQTFLRELIWRDFNAYLLWYNPSMPEKPLRGAFEHLPWRNDSAGLQAWQQGRTGVPIVDAGMRQLWQTGWMHNRVRMIVGSFLVKHLLIGWEAGEAWFWDTLVDADLASNAGNWQWVAGVGIDAQPYFRVFNPVSQGQKFDPDGAYVRRYVPEVARLSDAFLHSPWEAPADERQRAGVVLGETYPAPIVDLKLGRARALEVYARAAKAGAS